MQFLVNIVNHIKKLWEDFGQLCASSNRNRVFFSRMYFILVGSGSGKSFGKMGDLMCQISNWNQCDLFQIFNPWCNCVVLCLFFHCF